MKILTLEEYSVLYEEVFVQLQLTSPGRDQSKIEDKHRLLKGYDNLYTTKQTLTNKMTDAEWFQAYDTMMLTEYDRILKLHTNVNVINFPLNKDFASFKNNLKNHANGIFIFQIDADEVPHEYLITNMHELIEANLDIDLFFVPRVNTVEGLTQQHIDKWGWGVNDQGWVNFPDFQWRVYKNNGKIKLTDIKALLLYPKIFVPDNAKV